MWITLLVNTDHYTNAPTECSELDIIKWQINEVCDEQTLDSCRVTPVDVKHAISKLKKGKKDGLDYFMSDHLINVVATCRT